MFLKECGFTAPFNCVLVWNGPAPFLAKLVWGILAVFQTVFPAAMGVIVTIDLYPYLVSLIPDAPTTPLLVLAAAGGCLAAGITATFVSLLRSFPASLILWSWARKNWTKLRDLEISNTD